MHQFLKKCIQKLESLSNRSILSGLGELLDAKQKIWVKKNLRTETIFLLKIKLENYPAQPRAFLYSYEEGGNMFDPSGWGAHYYKEYKRGGIYNRPTSPAEAIINFDTQCNEAFLDMFLQAINEKNLQYINNKDAKKHALKGIKKGQALQFQIYLSEQKIQALITELNSRFSQ